ALIVGGALGNIIDRTFYGVIYGYGPLFYGEVVDFVHVDLWRGYVPDWVPFLGGDYMALFPIWNVADMAIVVGVAAIILFQRQFHEGMERARAAEHPAGLGTVEALSTDDAPEQVVDAPAAHDAREVEPKTPRA